MTQDAISFFRIGRDGLTAEMRRSGRRISAAQQWQEQLRVEFNQSCMLDGITIIMTTDGVVKLAGFRTSSEESRCDVDRWNALRGLPWCVPEKGSRSYRGHSCPTTSNRPSAFDATSALRHEGRREKVWY